MRIELERTLVKSPPELWEELVAAESGLDRWLGEVQVHRLDPPTRLEWEARGAHGTIELEPSGWGTRVRANAVTGGNGFWERFRLVEDSEVEQRLEQLLDDLGSSSLQAG
jgi:hypothetical protein